jgi:hypothetical protein
MTDPKASEKAMTVEAGHGTWYDGSGPYLCHGCDEEVGKPHAPLCWLMLALREYGDQREAAAVEKAAKAVCTHCRDVDLWEPPILRIGYEHHKRNSGIVRACRFSGGFRAFPNKVRGEIAATIRVIADGAGGTSSVRIE